MWPNGNREDRLFVIYSRDIYIFFFFFVIVFFFGFVLIFLISVLDFPPGMMSGGRCLPTATERGIKLVMTVQGNIPHTHAHAHTPYLY